VVTVVSGGQATDRSTRRRGVQLVRFVSKSGRLATLGGKVFPINPGDELTC
jgi:hypothetical protein